MSTSPKRGFTLVELTVCCVIVFVMLLVLPVLLPRRGCYCRPATGSSNEKQLALGFIQYIQDYDDRFPPAVGYVNGRAQSWGVDREIGGQAVPGLLAPYVKSSYLFLDIIPGAPVSRAGALEFMYNDLLAERRDKEVAQQTDTVLLVNAEDHWANAGHAFTPDTGPFPPCFNAHGTCAAGRGASIRDARTRHSGGANFALVDGHVKWFKGGTDDPVFFPPRAEEGESAVNPQTHRQTGPIPGRGMTFGERGYVATFHLR